MWFLRAEVLRQEDKTMHRKSASISYPYQTRQSVKKSIRVASHIVSAQINLFVNVIEPTNTYLQTDTHNTETIGRKFTRQSIAKLTNIVSYRKYSRLADVHLVVAEDVLLGVQQHVGLPRVQRRDVVEVEASLCELFAIVIVNGLYSKTMSAQVRR